MFRYSLSCLLAASVLLTFANPSLAAAPKYNDIMPVSQVKAGMTGYGLTVFRGTKIEHFQVTVVGVVKKGSLIVPGHDMILVRMTGGPMTSRQANLIRGMSGSPVYINGKIIGAFSQGEPATKEPLGGVTPIEDMLEAWDPKLPSSPLGALPQSGMRTAELAEPIQLGDRTIQKVVYNVPATSKLRSNGTTLVMHPCSTFVTFSGFSKSAMSKVAEALRPYNVEVAQAAFGGGQKNDFKGTPLVPGAAFSMMLVTGDVHAGATGTVTYRKGERILGFGHPFMGIGAIDAPLTSAWIYDVYPLLSGSYKISSPGPVVGSSTQDRNFAVSGILGRTPKTIPVTVDVRDLTTGRSRVFHAQAVAHPSLYSAMVSGTVGSAISEIRNTPGAAMARVTTTVDAEEIGPVTRSNVVFDMRGIDGAATQDLDDLLGIYTSNPFYPLGIKSANVRVEIESGHRTAQIERVFLKEGKFEPGETAEVGVVIKPYKQPAVTKTVKVQIPQNTPTGRYVLQVRGGAVPGGIQIGGFILRQSPASNPDQAPPVSIRQMVNRYNEREKNNDMVVRILLPTTAVNLDGEKLSNLPPSLDAIMRSAKSSAVRLERDEIKQVEHTDWVLSGQQLVALNVQRKEVREAPGGPTSPGGGPVISTSPLSTSTSVGFFGAGRDVEDAAAYAFISGLEAQKKKEAEQKKDKKAPAKDTGQTAPAPQTTQAASPPAASPAPVPETTSNDKPVARAALVWRQTSRTDFGSGTAHGVSVTSQGDLRLARSLKRLQTTPETFIWSMIPDDKGGLFLGTGTQGKVLRMDSSGQVSVFARLPEMSVHALLLAPDGTLWAGTAPNGRTYKIAPTGTFSVAHQAPEKYALALARDSKGVVYIGAGGSGNIYAVQPDGKSSVYFKTAEQHVLSLATDAANNLYAGTSTDGLVYRIQPGGKGTVIYDAPEQSITGLSVTSNGTVYAGTAPKGVIYRIDPDGASKAVLDKSAGAITSLRSGPGDTIYASAGNTIYAVQPDNTVTSFENHLDVDILALTVGKDGTVYAGTGNVAEVYAAVSPSSSMTGSYESVVHDAKQRSSWGTVRWSADTPGKSSVRIETRTGNVADPDSTWSAWSAPRMVADGGRITSPPARFIQYRVTLNSDSPDAVPDLRDIAISYLPKNQAPQVAFQAPAGGERWANKQTVKWSSVDPDKDTLSYEVFVSSDNGAHWEPLPSGAVEKMPPTAKPADTGTAAKPADGSPIIARLKPPSVADVTAELDRHPDLPPSLRDKIIEQTRTLNTEYDSQGTAGTVAAATAAAQPSAPTRESNRSLDTKSLPDGTYRLKVVASDRPSNAVDTQTAQAVSESFVICNTPPTLYLFKDAVKVEPNGVVTAGGSAVQKMVSVSAVQFRVDGGDWVAAVPADGIFDSQIENFGLSTPPLSKGQHTIEVKAFNAANLQASDKITVEVK